MRRHASALVVAAVLALTGAAPALADQYYTVTGTADAAGSCTPDDAGLFTCTTLRAAVDAANANPGDDFIELQATGTYPLAQPLTLLDNVSIYSEDPRQVTFRGAGTDRVLIVDADASAYLYGVTIDNGVAPATGAGGDVLNNGSLYLYASRVTNGSAADGGGIYSTGTLELAYALVDHNQGGGVVMTASGTPPSMLIFSSTIAFTTGAGVAASGDGVQVTLWQDTIARNAGPGVQVQSGASWLAYGSILAGNGGGNCGVAVADDEGYNLEDQHGCGFGSTSKVDTDPGLSAQLENHGGWSDVLAFGPASPAVDLVADCFFGVDQRGFDRVTSDTSACDAGAYEQSATGAPSLITDQQTSGSTATFTFGTGASGEQFECRLDTPSGTGTWAPCTSPKTYNGLAPGGYQFFVRGVDASGAPTGPPDTRSFSLSAPRPLLSPTPTPSPAPAPTATPTPTPTPVPGKTVVAAPVSGKVLVKKPGGKGFVEIDATQGIPLGSTVDTTHGVVQITAKSGQVAKFYDGIFKITQTKATTDLTLNQPLACGKQAKGASAAAKKPKSRKLWGDGSGSFRTRGQYSSATVRGTTWLVQDTCAGTLTRVKKGVVSVQDDVRHKTILLKAGKSYLAKPRH